MAAKILLSLSSRKACLALFERGAVKSFAAYDNDERALGAFGEMMARHLDAPVYLMVDTVEEDYRTELLPHVWGSARREMAKRKLAQLFRTLPYRAAWLQGRDRTAGKRRDDLYLFLALNSGDLLRPYLEYIHARRAPLAGIYLLPQVTQALAARLECDTPGMLVVSRQQGGLRQSFFLEGHLRISRLTPLDPLGDPATTESYAAEVEKSRLFLYNSRLLPREARLSVMLLDIDGSLNEVSNLLSQDTSLHCQRIDYGQLQKALSCAPNELPRDPEALHLFLLGKNPPAVSLAEPRLTSDFSAQQLGSSLYVASAAIAVAALLWSAYSVYRGFENQADTQSAIVDTARYHAQYADAAKQFPATPVAAEHLRQAVEVADQIKKLGRTPETFMQTLSVVLGAFPQIELNRFDWRYAAASAAPGAAVDSSPSAWQQQGEIEAEIRPFNGDYRAALQLIERFAAGLRAQPAVAAVNITKLPLNLDPASTLSGSTQDSASAQPGAAQFKLSITLRRDQ